MAQVYSCICITGFQDVFHAMSVLRAEMINHAEDRLYLNLPLNT